MLESNLNFYAHHYHLLGLLVISRHLSSIRLLFGRIMTLNHNLYKIMNAKGYGIIMIEISVELSWNFSWKVFTTGQMFTRLTYFQHHSPALNFSSAAVFLQSSPARVKNFCLLPPHIRKI